MGFHLHAWKEVRRTWRAPPFAAFELRGTKDQIDRLMHGCTSAELRCDGCGTITNSILIGNLTASTPEGK